VSSAVIAGANSPISLPYLGWFSSKVPNNLFIFGQLCWAVKINNNNNNNNNLQFNIIVNNEIIVLQRFIHSIFWHGMHLIFQGFLAISKK
jgi:hypothetical protein